MLVSTNEMFVVIHVFNQNSSLQLRNYRVQLGFSQNKRPFLHSYDISSFANPCYFWLILKNLLDLHGAPEI